MQKQVKLKRAIVTMISLALTMPPSAFAGESNAAGKTAAAATAASSEVPAALFNEIEQLIKEYYSKVKVVRQARSIHFEHKVRTFLAPITQRPEKGPDLGGIICNLEVVSGPYAGKEKLPKQFNEHFHSVLIMAPYSKPANCHLMAHIEFAPDAAPDFLEKFRTLVNSYDQPGEPSSTSATPDSSSSTKSSSPVAAAEPSPPATASATTPPATASATTPPATASATTPPATASATTPPAIASAAALPAQSSTNATAPAKSDVPTPSKTDPSIEKAPTGTTAVKKNESDDDEGEDDSDKSLSEKVKLFFWKATNGKQTVYVLGSIDYHARATKFLPLPLEMERALVGSKAILVQTLNFDDKLSHLANSKCVYQSKDDQLSRHISSDTKRAFETYLPWSEETMQMYEIFKPWYASLALDKSIIRRETLDEVKLDSYLSRMAKQFSKPIVELEPADGRIAALSSLPEDIQDKNLRMSINRLMNWSAIEKDLEEGWRAGDAARVEQALLSPGGGKDTDLAGVYAKLTDDRTRQLFQKLQESAKEPGSYFVAVDASHLVGDNNLLSMLKQKGFNVEQMMGRKVVESKTASTKVDFGGSKLSRYSFPEGRFSVMLPGVSEPKYQTKNGLRLVDYHYSDVHGAYSACYGILPGTPRNPSLLLEKLSECLPESVDGKILQRIPCKLQNEFPGVQLYVKIKKKDTRLADEDLTGCVRIFLVRRFLYIVGTIGRRDWVNSSISTQFLNSLSVRPELTPLEEMAARMKERERSSSSFSSSTSRLGSSSSSRYSSGRSNYTSGTTSGRSNYTSGSWSGGSNYSSGSYRP